jgi:hypothetical protein
MEIELLRIDERASGIAAPDPGPGAERVPLARGSAVGVVGRAWVVPGPTEPRVRDTGDVRRVEYYASEADPRLDAIRHDAAVRSAARRLGRDLARRVLGQPVADIEPM